MLYKVQSGTQVSYLKKIYIKSNYGNVLMCKVEKFYRNRHKVFRRRLINGHFRHALYLSVISLKCAGKNSASFISQCI